MLYLWEHNSVLAPFIEHTKDIKEANTVIVWNDLYPVERGIINYARSKGKKAYVMQHGRRGSSRYFPPFKDKIYADKLLVWGEADKESLIEAGQDASKIEVVGTPILKKLKARVPHKGINIVFSPEHWDRPLKENVEVRDLLRKLKGVKIQTKLIYSASHTEEYDNPVRTHVSDPDHLERLIDLLKWADLVVGISESTLELIAQAMDIPVVIMEEWEPKNFKGDPKYLTYRRVISKGAKRATMETLLATIKQQLANPDELKQERAEIVLAEGGKWDEGNRLFKK